MNAENDRLTGRGHQLSTLGKQMHTSMRKTIMHAMDTNIAQHPFGRHHLANTDRIVQTVTTGIAPDRIPDR